MNSGSPGWAGRFDGVKWKCQPLQEMGVFQNCSSLLQTRDGVLWVGGNGAVAANRDGHWQVYEPRKVPIPTVRTLLFQSSDGAMWIAGQDAEVLRLDYQTPRWTAYQALNFQWESPEGAQWFLHRDERVACERSRKAGQRLEVRTSCPGADCVRIEVRDNGIGISKENLTSIFNQDFTTRKTNHGFGLHDAANAAKQMGGSLTAQSDGPCQGATFTMEFPIDNSKSVQSAEGKN
jgi:hypothetical protein